jgi:hypothetical protein
MVFWLVGEMHLLLKMHFKVLKNWKKDLICTFKHFISIHKSFVEKRYFYVLCKKYKKNVT